MTKTIENYFPPTPRPERPPRKIPPPKPNQVQTTIEKYLKVDRAEKNNV